MDELKKNNILHIVLKDGSKIKGIVEDYQKDRVMVLVDDTSIETAKKINELDDLEITAETQFGLKMMISSVIYSLNDSNCIIIENTPSLQVVQKRAHVRAVDDFEFQIEYNDKSFNAKCLNISASGIAFKADNAGFELNQKINLIFEEEIFSKKITCQAEIIKKNDDNYSAVYTDINEHDQNKIVKRIYKLLSKK